MRYLIKNWFNFVLKQTPEEYPGVQKYLLSYRAIQPCAKIDYRKINKIVRVFLLLKQLKLFQRNRESFETFLKNK